MTALTRKTVTVLFADVVGSTPLGEARDPEVVRSMMERYFEGMSAVIARHGGTVEKYIGDAVMAVFGVPSAHEDDALRAVRAAVEMRDALAELNRELPEALAVRTGVNTGPVVVGEGRTLATGDAVNVAARLQQAAAPSEILVGEATHALVRDAVVAEPVGDLSLKGKTQDTAAWRLLAVLPDAPGRTRRFDTPLVGRGDELAMLQQAFSRVVTRRGCHLFTILGPAGVGKSRLAREFVGPAAGEATVVVGRCLPYGEGITYWPLREIVRSLGVAAETLGRSDAAILDAAVGDGRAAAGPEETARAFRRLVEHAARSKPLVLTFEDIHWAEPALLALVEHLADTARDAPVLLLCLARPELLDDHPSWGGGKLNATTILLDPLDAAVSESLLSELGGNAIPRETRRMITAVAEGNPLFLEEIVAMVVDEGAAPVAPPSVQALLTARLELLPGTERTALAAAAVVGRFFSRDALAVLAGDDGVAALAGLERKDLIRPNVARLDRADYRFRHILIRDAAYESLPKARRAELHVRLADWLEHEATDTQREADELVAWHLEQAHDARRDVALPADDVGRRAFEALAALGRQALNRGDAAAAVTLLDRALAISLPLDHARVAVRFDLVPALLERGELARADELVALAGAEADALADDALRARATVERLEVDFLVRPARWVETATAAVEAALPTLEAAGDDAALARAWLVIVAYDYVRGRNRDLSRSLERALAHARRSGAQRRVGDVLVLAVRSLVFGPEPVEDALARCDAIAAEGGDEGVIHGVRAALHAMAGRFDEARAAYRAGQALLEEYGRTRLIAVEAVYAAVVELLAGDAAAAERELRSSLRVLEAIGDDVTVATVASLLAVALHDQGRDEEARSWASRSRRDSPAIDLISQVQWRIALAGALGADPEAVVLAREAAELAGATDATPLQADALLALRDALLAAGTADEAELVSRRAAELYRAKGHAVGVRRAGSAPAPASSGGT